MAAQADLVFTTGGISVGEEDHVIPAGSGSPRSSKEVEQRVLLDYHLKQDSSTGGT